MATKNRFGFNTTKFFIVLLLSFITIQIISYLLSEIMDYPMLKMGWVLLIFLVVIGIVSLFVLGKRLGQLELKKDGLFILLIFGMIILAFIYLPEIIPQIFSAQSLEVGEYFKKIINVIMKLSPGGITPN